MGFGGGGGGSSVIPVAFGTAAARPAANAGNSGTGYYSTDTGALAFSNGATWNEVTFFNNDISMAVGKNLKVQGTPAGGLISTTWNQQFFGPNNGLMNLTNASLDITSGGKGLMVAEGSNAKQGTATLTAGTVTVANTSVTATSRIMGFSNTDGGAPGWLRNSGRTAGTSFTVTSSSGTDTSTFAYEIFEVG